MIQLSILGPRTGVRCLPQMFIFVLKVYGLPLSYTVYPVLEFLFGLSFPDPYCESIIFKWTCYITELREIWPQNFVKFSGFIKKKLNLKKAVLGVSQGDCMNSLQLTIESTATCRWFVLERDGLRQVFLAKTCYARIQLWCVHGIGQSLIWASTPRTHTDWWWWWIF